MLDILVLSGLGLAVLRGYRRGVLRAVAGLVVLVVGIVVAYRAGPIGQGVAESWTGASPLTSRFIASAVVFLVVFVGARLLISRLLALSGPARLLDQIGGALVSAAAFAVMAGLLILAVASAPYLPAGVGQVLDQSRTVALVTSEGPRFTPGISRLLGDRILESYLNLQRLSEGSPALLDGVGDVVDVGGSGGVDTSPVEEVVEDLAVPVIQLLDRLVVIEGDERVEIPPVGEPVEDRADLAIELLDMLNLLRIEEGEEPLAWSAALAEIAGGHGVEMYAEGYFSHVSPVTGSVADRLAVQGIPFRVAGENLALNPTVDGVHGGLATSPSHRATMLEPRFTRVGISVHDGPLGLMVVQVFTG
ncbi:MAG: CvpA family protein [bacterium]|nr:CvpA family protein [bacterium]MDE0353673.1 CvpA family protein [bacterium]